MDEATPKADLHAVVEISSLDEPIIVWVGEEDVPAHYLCGLGWLTFLVGDTACPPARLVAQHIRTFLAKRAPPDWRIKVHDNNSSAKLRLMNHGPGHIAMIDNAAPANPIVRVPPNGTRDFVVRLHKSLDYVFEVEADGVEQRPITGIPEAS